MVHSASSTFLVGILVAAIATTPTIAAAAASFEGGLNCTTLDDPVVGFYKPSGECETDSVIVGCNSNHTSCLRDASTCTATFACVSALLRCLEEAQPSSLCADWTSTLANELLYIAAGSEYGGSGLQLSCHHALCEAIDAKAALDCSPTSAAEVCVDPTSLTTPTPQTPTPQTPMPETPTPQTPAPTERCTVDCGSHGYAWHSSWSNTCGCHCFWPFGGPRCDACRDPSFIFVDGNCVPCVDTTYRRYSAIGGTNFPFRIREVRPGCLSAASVEVQSASTWMTARVPVVAGVASISIPTCTATDQTWRKLHYVSLVVGRSRRSLGAVSCVTPFDFSNSSNDVPPNTHIHLQHPRGTLPAVLSVVGGLWLRAANVTNITLTAYNTTTLLSLTPQSMTLDLLQVALLDFVGEGATLQSSSWWWEHEESCRFFSRGNALGSAAQAVPLATTTLVVVGDLRHCGSDPAMKQAWNADLLAAVQASGANAMWIATEPSPPLGVTGISFTEWDPINELHDAMTNHFLLARPVQCGSGILSYFPLQVSVLQRAVITFFGVCDITRCCVGSRCSPFVRNAGRASCFTPHMPQGEYVVSVVTATGVTISATEPLRVVESRLQYHTWRWTSWAWHNGAWRATPGNRIAVFRTNSWLSRGVVNAARCCSVVGVTHQLAITAALSEEVCFESFAQLTLPCWTPNLVVEAPFLLALQCHRPLLEANGTDFGTSDIVAGDAPFHSLQTAAGSGPGAANAQPRATRWKIDRYVRWITNTARGHTTSRGRALEYVVRALQHANLHSTHPPQERPCPGQRQCFFAWTADAKDAGPHLVSAGFTEIASDWYWSNAVVGDVAVFPSVSYLDAEGRNVSYPRGHIAIRIEPEEDGLDWAADFQHPSIVFAGLRSALEGGRPVIGGGGGGGEAQPRLYRLRDDVGEFPRNEEVLVPIEGTECVVDNATEWTARWCNDYDSAAWNRTEIVALIAAHYRCPAFISPRDTLFPSQLWRMWMGRSGVGAFAATCLRMWPTAARPWGLRCCYNRNNAYISEWPSQIEWEARSWSQQWARRINDVSEQIACVNAGGSLTTSCQKYQECRPAPPSTNNLWARGSLWTPQRRFGGAFGDPHCETMDGLRFECNFHGEAVWTACGSWRVHAVAETPEGSEHATVITRFAVQAETDTVVGFLKLPSPAEIEAAQDAGRHVVNFELFLNGEAVDAEMGARGTTMTVAVANSTVTIEDGAGNAVVATFHSSMIALSTAPADACRGITEGLCGNNDDDPTNDLRPRGSAMTLPHDSSNEDIYRDFVLSWLVEEASESLFPASNFIPGNASFIPFFSNASLLAACPAACNNDTSCCFDAAVGGAEFVEQFHAATADRSARNAVAMRFNAAWPPQFDEAPTRVGMPEAGHDAEQLLAMYVAASSESTITMLNCSACKAEGVRCELAGLGTANATLWLRATRLDAGHFECTAQDAAEARATAATLVVYTDRDRVISSPAPVPTLPPAPDDPSPSEPSGPADSEETPAPATGKALSITAIAVAGAGVVVVTGLVMGLGLLIHRKFNRARTATAASEPVS